jgi:hypothetical protein
VKIVKGKHGKEKPEGEERRRNMSMTRDLRRQGVRYTRKTAKYSYSESDKNNVA